MSFALKLNHAARESGYFRSSDRDTLLKRLKALVEDGKVDESVLKSAEAKFNRARAKVINTREFSRFEYIKGVTPDAYIPEQLAPLPRTKRAPARPRPRTPLLP